MYHIASCDSFIISLTCIHLLTTCWTIFLRFCLNARTLSLEMRQLPSTTSTLHTFGDFKSKWKLGDDLNLTLLAESF